MNHQSLLARIRLAEGEGSSDSPRDEAHNQSDPIGLRFLTNIAVWGHWVSLSVFLYEIAHHISDEFAEFFLYTVLVFILAGITGALHYRLWSNRTLAWSWLQILFTLDVVFVSVWLALSDGFGHPFIHLFYYPVLAAFALVLGSFRHSMAMVTAVSAVYVGITLTVGDGIDLASNEEEAVLARIVVMYAIVASVTLATRFERVWRRQAVERGRVLERERVEMSLALQQERIELSHTIHDTAAQSAYMIGLGIDTARSLAGDTNPELTATLEETSRLSRSTLWDLRHPISLGGIYAGKELGSALRSHSASFTNVSGVPAKATQTGAEPPLSTETKSRLFSIAHNALTNAYRHARASRVAVHLAFGEEGIRLSVSDDGTGLPDDYMGRGSGFASMTSAAKRLEGRLIVEKRGPLGGASVTCLVPPEHGGEERRHGTG